MGLEQRSSGADGQGAVLRLLSRRRCLSCGDELPPTREYPMRVCATCILAPAQAAPRTGLPERAQASAFPADWHDDRNDGA